MMVENVIDSENSSVSIGLITAPSVEIAKKLATKLLDSRCVACVNLIPSIESMYRWEGKIQTDRETLMIVKTTQALNHVLLNSSRRNTLTMCLSVSLLGLMAAMHRTYLGW